MGKNVFQVEHPDLKLVSLQWLNNTSSRFKASCCKHFNSKLSHVDFWMKDGPAKITSNASFPLDSLEVTRYPDIGEKFKCKYYREFFFLFSKGKWIDFYIFKKARRGNEVRSLNRIFFLLRTIKIIIHFSHIGMESLIIGINYM